MSSWDRLNSYYANEELHVEEGTTRPRKGGDQASLAVRGGTIASAVIDTLFGFAEPPKMGPGEGEVWKGREKQLAALILERREVDRGFAGRLENVRWQGLVFDIESVIGEGLQIINLRD